MKYIIRSSSDLRRNYNSIAEICRKTGEPVFLTRNGEGDTVLMDVEAFSRRERDLEDAERLLASERARLEGTCGYSVEEFAANMREAVKTGSRRKA
ncbi:MAG: hypothetical protein PWP10_3115 [Clostridiales bacterium]|jgi:prevent-host-death family protein|nr:hypothetical protein [Clostridiales bacterium]